MELKYFSHFFYKIFSGGAAVGQLRVGSFGESGEDWWGLLTAVSREVGFTLTRTEERCER